MPPPSPPPNTPNPSDPITLPSLIPLTPTQSPNANTYSYTVDLSDKFCIGTVPNGGYITTAFLHCARTHMTLTRPKLSSRDPINLHLQFLRRTSAGPAVFHVREVKLGARISNLHLTLSQHRDPTSNTEEEDDNNMQVEVEGYIVLTSLSEETGLSHSTGYKLNHPTVMAVDFDKLNTNTDTNYILRRRDPYSSFRRAAHHVEMYLVRPDRRPPGAGPAIVDQWVRFRPVLDDNKHEGRWTNDALGYLVDIFPQLNERFLNPELEDAVLTPADVVSDDHIRDLTRRSRANADGTATAPRAYWYPTLLLNLDIKKALPEAGVEWLFVRLRAKSIENGRFDLDVEVWDSRGGLVALSTHASLIVDAERNIKRNNGSSKKKGKSKI